GERRPVDVDTNAVGGDDIVCDREAVGLLQADAVAAGAAVAEQLVAANLDPGAVHEVHADGVALQAVVLDGDLIAEHEMQAVATVVAGVAADGDTGGVPEDGIPAVMNDIVLDERVVGPPQAEAVAAAGDIQLLAADAI